MFLHSRIRRKESLGLVNFRSYSGLEFWAAHLFGCADGMDQPVN
jgi:hypothetical protein